ncbi:xanthine dehydrogenase family protein subunit M [Neobacillus notoginsengisoli]|uniref:Xanthine dehydrogenase family protein subunit M n=1 Tax=Neobacillus notoginsengisoli TaxID=1578198 RepID=A0A417YW16_9BACI|nr:xanthine dehydrogenase family protein subunit M [Neobacillus notoginsengisoli]RHW41582.1 xanthine dehydrogenase family protein subunit M [Neobacillus notoginsengisoli]
MMISDTAVLSPKTVEECLGIIANSDRDFRLIAGGTDAIVRMKEGKWRPEVWVNIKGISELRYIKKAGQQIHLGPLTTHTDIVNSEILKGAAEVLIDAAREVGAAQIQNAGTIGGNIATASPAGDTIPALYVLGAVIELSSADHKRYIPIEEFFIGPGRTVKKDHEMITNIIIQPQDENEISIFQKLGPRKAQSISIVNVAIALSMEKGTNICLGGKIAFGSVGPTIVRAKKCEAMLTIEPLTIDHIQNIAKVAWKEVMPISDIRASAQYRRDMASSLLERGLYRLMKRWDER